MAEESNPLSLLLEFDEVSPLEGASVTLQDAGIELAPSAPVEAPLEDNAPIDDIQFPEPPPQGDFTGLDAAMPEQRLPTGEAIPPEPKDPADQASTREVIGAAVEAEWSVAVVARSMYSDTPDPNFELTSESFEALTQGLPEAYWEEFTDVVSEDHGQALRKRLLEEYSVQQKLEQAGGWGILARVGAAIFDPGAIALTAATSGVAAPFLLSAKVGRVGRALRIGGIAAAENVAIDSMIIANTPSAQNSDLLYSAFGGLALGSIAGGLSRGEIAKDLDAVHDISRQAQRDLEFAEQNPGKPIPEPEVPAATVVTRSSTFSDTGLYDVVLPNGETHRIFRDTEQFSYPVWHVDGDKGNPAGVGSTRAEAIAYLERNQGDTPGDMSVGAAQALPVERSRLNASTQEMADDAVDAPYTAMGAVRFDSVGQLKGSPNDLSRQTGDVLGEDAVGNANGAPAGRGGTASETQELINRTVLTKFHRTVGKEHFNAYAEAQGITGLITRRRAKLQFNEDVAKQVRSGGSTDPHIVAAAASTAEIHSDLLLRLKEAGVRGFENVEENANYVMRLYSPQKLARMTEAYKEDGVRMLIQRSIQEVSPEIEEEVAARIAKWHFRKVRDRGDQIDLQMGRALSGDDNVTLRNVLVEENVLTDLEADRLFALVGKPQEGHSRSRQRLFLDESTTVKLRNAHTGEMDDVRLDSMFENDIETLVSLYTRQTSGAIAMAQAGFDSVSAFQTHLSKVRLATMDLVGTLDRKGKLIDRDRAIRIANKDQENLEFLGTMIFGRPIGDTATGRASFKRSGTGKFMKRLRDYNFVRVMNQVGLAQIPELGNTLGTMGIRAFMTSLPAFRDIVRGTRGGRLADVVSDEIETIWGSGTDVLRGNAAWRWDDFGSGFDATSDATRGNRVDTMLDHGKRFSNLISGMATVNTTIQKWAAKSAVQRFVDMAHGNTRVWSKQRLAGYGLSPEDAENIFAGIRANVVTTKGSISPNKVKRIGDLSEWADGDAAERFRMAIFRISRQAVQENDPGNLPRIMGNDLAQTVGQFRTFMLVSIYKQFLRGVNERDINTWTAFTLSSFMAGLVYVGQTHMRSAGRDDRDDYLEERLTPEAIGKAAVGRSGWGAIVPFVVDTMAESLDQDPLFSHYRTTGLDSSILGNPTLSLINDNMRKGVLGTAGNLAVHGEVSQENIRNLLGIAAFQNAYGIANINRMLYQDLPRQVSK